jgi:heme/copper-type cytochrome/quinol oxidase subunit 2
MRFRVIVMEQDEFDAWISQQQAAAEAARDAQAVAE